MTQAQYGEINKVKAKSKQLLYMKNYYASRAQQAGKKGNEPDRQRFIGISETYRIKFERLKLPEGICLFTLWSDFCITTFGHTKEIALEKLKEEIAEFSLDNEKSQLEELADVILVAFSICGVIGITVDQLMDIINLKADICMSSQWIKQPNGTFKRTKK